jgi:ATP-dependent Lhr-like helicase
MHTAEALRPFGDLARDWFAGAFAAPTPVQAAGWARIAAGDHTLMLAPTGSGKTLAAFLWCLDRLVREPPAPRSGVQVIYVSPLKALAYDVEKNLRAPLEGMRRVAAARGVVVPELRIDVRTGDTPAAERRRQAIDPAPIVITTPESLYLLLGSRAADKLTGVRTIIVDEIHAMAPTKRGAHLALSLERLAHLVTSRGGAEPQRIGLSATQRPLAEVARFLGGDREVAIVDAGMRPRLDLQVVVPVPDMTAPAAAAATEQDDDPGERGMWPAIYPVLLELVLAHRSTILFVNSRRTAEKLAQKLTALAVATGRVSPRSGDAELVRAHHGSVARHQREEIEAALKAGALRAIAATSSLELGIDMGAVDLVVQVQSPGGIARGLQRIGRAGHHVGGTPRGRIVPLHRGDLLEAAVVADKMLVAEVEAIRVPENALDVLAQQIVAMCAVRPWPVAELERVVRRAAGYRDLGRAALIEVLEMLSGRYPSDDFAELRPRLAWDRAADVLTARRGARLLSVVNAGTIPDRGLYGVYVGEDGPRVGELDEEMVHESRPGETFLLGATTWRIEAIEASRVIVSPAPGEPGKMPFWRGEGPGRPYELGKALGAFVRAVDARAGDDLRAWLAADFRCDAFAADNIGAHVAAQRAAGAVPTDETIVVERFRDELGDWRICVMTPFGAQVHAPWALAIERRLSDARGGPVHASATDDGMAFRFADGDRLPDAAELFPDPDELDDEVTAELARSSVLAARFREAAARALLLPRRRPGLRTPLWSMRQRATQLLGVALRYPSFPIVLEAYRECLRDVFDLPALREVLAGVKDGAIRVETIETERASPFARGLVFDFVAAYLYEGDAPPAERRAQAVTLDRALLRELVGERALRDLLDPVAVAEVEHELAGRPAASADELHDRLRTHGDLRADELDPAAAGVLEAQGRAARVTLAGEPRWIAAEDAARVGAALGAELPASVPAALRGPAPAAGDALESLVKRWGRTHGPFEADAPAARWGVPVAEVRAAIDRLAARGELETGAFRPGGAGVEHVDPEVLRRLRRRTLARLRAQIAPVDGAVLGRFLPRWHGVGAGRRGPGALRDALAKLEGCPLSFVELEARILPARVADYAPRMLDELGAAGEIVWVGAGLFGECDGRVRIVRRDRAAALVAPGDAAALGPLHQRIADHLRRAGASFLVAIEQVASGAPGHGSDRDRRTGGADRASVRDALWDLVWAGVVTNDTFAPLRSLRAKPSARPVRASPGASFGGRWSLVETLAAGAPGTGGTARAHALATALLDRWGVVARDAAAADGVPGGFAAVADVYTAMEESGAVRRGYFVDGLAGRQYAWPGALDRLRAARDRDPGAVVLAAADPANPYGAILPWPEADRAARRTGALVVLVAGAPVFFVEPRGKRLTTFTAASPEARTRAARALPEAARFAPRRQLVIETVDGVRVQESPLAPLLAAAGGRADYRGVVLESSRRAAEPASDPEADEDDDAAGG